MGEFSNNALLTSVAPIKSAAQRCLCENGQINQAAIAKISGLTCSVIEDVVHLSITKDFDASKPLLLSFIQSEGSSDASISVRNAMVINVSHPGVVTLIEEYSSSFDETEPYTVHASRQITVQANSAIKYYKIQHDSLSATHQSHFECKLERDARCETYHLSVGAKACEDRWVYHLSEQGAACQALGLYHTKGSQSFQFSSEIIHSASNTSSNQHYKGLGDDASHTLFDGKIIVKPNCQQIVAHQKNENCLLSNRAKMESRPNLEIDADDVICSHGATIGQIDEAALFYCRSRGIDVDQALQLLKDAFMQEILDRFVGGQN